MNTELTPEERLQVFGEWAPPTGYAEDSERRWGGTDAWAEAQVRVPRMTKQQWEEAERERREWATALRAAVERGVSPDSIEGMQLAERHRLGINRFFDCTHPIHVEITKEYVTRPEIFGFAVRPNEQVSGMGLFLRDAALANAARRGDGPA